MTFSALLDLADRSTEDHMARVVAALGSWEGSVWSSQPEPGIWSCGQVVEHLVLANSRYIAVAESVMPACPAADPETEVAHSFIGRFLVRAAGPEGNAPAPAAMRPGPPEIVDRARLEEWRGQQGQIAELAAMARGKDLNRKLFRNPYVPLFRMCLADFFRLSVDHTERHVRQIEERAAKVPQA